MAIGLVRHTYNNPAYLLFDTASATQSEGTLTRAAVILFVYTLNTSEI